MKVVFFLTNTHLKNTYVLTSTYKSILLYTVEWNYVIFTDGSMSAKELWKKYNLRWWGSDLVAQWKDDWVGNII